MDKIQLIYLQKLLKRCDVKWSRISLKVLEEKRIGWFKKIYETLEKYELPTDFSVIRTMPIARWERLVKNAIEVQNEKRIKQDLYKTVDGVDVPKTKTKTIIEKISTQGYTRQPEPEIKYMTKLETKTTIIARYGMLECGTNFKGTHTATCVSCNKIDNEHHRMNECPRWKDLSEETEMMNFDLIYSNCIDSIRPVIDRIMKTWNTKCAHGTMHKK